jgi:1,4-dihydroxy-2-naphthoate octaprenyltransferase
MKRLGSGQIKFISFIDRDTWLHLRIPFSFFLFPVFFFAVSQANDIDLKNTVLIFIILHLFIYPASNAYNSFMDKDTGSIGGLRKPPPVTQKLYYASIVLDAIGLMLSFFISWQMFFIVVLYVCVSKAYSWKKIRLKKYGILGWFVVALFQGGYTFFLVNMAVENNFTGSWFSYPHGMCMLIASMLIGGFYPLTQIYQHEEDARHGDLTISYRLGINGTFIFSGLFFFLACTAAYFYFIHFYILIYFFVFIICLLPVALYYLYWFHKAFYDQSFADFTHTMRMIFLSSMCMIICFTVIFFMNHKNIFS